MVDDIPTPPDRLTPTDRPKAPAAITPGEEQQQPSTSFETYMHQPKTSSAQSPTAGVSPYDLAGQGKVAQPIPTQEALNTQLKAASSQLGDIQNQLNTKNLTLKQSQKYLLRNKLKNANDFIRTATAKTGAELTQPPTLLSRQNPIQKYLAMVTDSQKNLENAQSQLQKLSTNGQTMEPGQLLLIQVKLSKAQQELEYSSILLSKAIDDIKTLFNIQL